MKKSLLAAFGIVAGLAANSEAASINNVVVTIGSNVWSDATVGWPVPINLNPGESVVLTQMGGYNFDTSDGVDEGRHNTPRIDITMDGVMTSFFDTTGILNVKGLDPITNEDNEAQEFGDWINGPGYRVRFAYWDNVHTGKCGEWATSVGLNGASTCVPSGLYDATYLFGAGAAYPSDLGYSNYPWHCNEHGGCRDGGVIQVETYESTTFAAPVPEPASLLLFGFGLIGVAAVAKRRKRQS